MPRARNTLIKEADTTRFIPPKSEVYQEEQKPKERTAQWYKKLKEKRAQAQ